MEIQNREEFIEEINNLNYKQGDYSYTDFEVADEGDYNYKDVEYYEGKTTLEFIKWCKERSFDYKRIGERNV